MNRDILISQIMNTSPYQLPPIHHGNGVYSLDIEYQGQTLNKTGISLEEVLKSYFEFVTKVNFRCGEPTEPMASGPGKPGKKMYSTRRPFSHTA